MRKCSEVRKSSFGLYDIEGKKDLDKSHTTCKLCRTKLKYFGNMTNMRNHITRFQPEEQEKQLVVVASNQRTIEQAITNFPPNSRRVKQITNSITTFIAKDLRQYSVVENQGFHAMFAHFGAEIQRPFSKIFN